MAKGPPIHTDSSASCTCKDCLSAVELSLDLETEFDVEISDEELAALVTVEDIVKLIESKQ